jgi:hypothetical protein
MVRLTTAGGEECGAPGDYLSWAEAEWELHSMARNYTIPASEGPCRVQSDMHFYTADFSSLTDCMEHCEKLGDGRSPPVRTLQEWETLNEKLRQISPDITNMPYSGQYLWLSATDEEDEGKWRDYYTSEVIGNYIKPWNSISEDYQYDYQDTMYDCLMMGMNVPTEYSWMEWTCTYDMSCACQYERRPLLTLRGLCRDNHPLDWVYTPRQLPGNSSDLFLLGNMTTQIRYNDSSSRWVLTDARYSVSGESEATKLSYLLGKHPWTMHDDTFCNKTLQKEWTGQTMTYIYFRIKMVM